MHLHRTYGLACALLAAAQAAHAGFAYDYTIEHSGGADWRVEAAVEVRGARQRVNFSNVTGYMSQTALSDYRTGAFALSTAGMNDATFYYPEQRQMLERHIVPGASFHQQQQVEGNVTKGIGTSVEDVHVSVRDSGDGGIIEGLSTHKVTIQFSFVNDVVVGPYKTSGKREYTSEVWTTDRIDTGATAFLAYRQFRDQMPDEVNALIQQHDAFAHRFVLRRITTARIPVKGEIVTSVTTESVSHFHDNAIGDAEFVAPMGYDPVKHAPVPPH